jgi:tetratricopeptide (TPR) repeat protein
MASQHERKGDFKTAADLYIKFANKEYKEARKNRKVEGDYLSFVEAAKGFKAAAFCFKKLKELAKVRNNLKKALDAYEKSITSFALFQDIYEAPGIEFHTMWLRKRIADVYSQLEEKDQAIKIYQGVIDFLDIKLRAYEREATTNKLFYGDAGVYCELLAMIYQKLGEYKKAFEYCDKAEAYLAKEKHGAVIQTHEPYYYEFEIDFVEELILEGVKKGVCYAEENPEIFQTIGDFKTRIKLRRELIKKAQKKIHS